MKTNLTMLLVKSFDSEYSSHLSAFNICPTEDLAILSLRDLLDFYPLSAYKVHHKTYLSLKHLVFDEELYSKLT